MRYIGYSSDCCSPYAIASDGDINYQNCTNCTCNPACDYLGAIILENLVMAIASKILEDKCEFLFKVHKEIAR